MFLDVWLCRMPRWVEVHEIASGLNRRPAPEGGASAKAVPSSPSVSGRLWTSFDSPSRSQLCASLGEDEAEDGQEDAAQRQCQQRLSLVRRPSPSFPLLPAATPHGGGCAGGAIAWRLGMRRRSRLSAQAGQGDRARGQPALRALGPC